jgi:hypothetical protein
MRTGYLYCLRVTNVMPENLHRDNRKPRRLLCLS